MNRVTMPEPKLSEHKRKISATADTFVHYGFRQKLTCHFQPYRIPWSRIQESGVRMVLPHHLTLTVPYRMRLLTPDF